MSTEALAVETTSQDIYEAVVRPKLVIGQWATRTRRTSADVQLQSTAWGVIASLDEFLALPLTKIGIEVFVRSESDPPIEEHWLSEADRLGALLDAIRELRKELHSGIPTERLYVGLRRREPSLAAQFNTTRLAAVARLGEWEKLLVLLGAGTDADAHLGQELMPSAREDLPPGVSVSFDL